jgi:hypothetical protein
MAGEHGFQAGVGAGATALIGAVLDITAITPTSNPLSSPALSLDRLRIDYGKGRSVMISPRDKQGFLGAMESARSGGI